MSLLGMLDQSLLRRGTQAALEWRDESGSVTSSTFSDVERRSNQFAHVLRARGLTQGQRICVYLPNSPSYIDLFIACVKLGIVLVPINILYRDREIGHIVDDAEPFAIVSSNGMLESVPAGVAQWSLKEIVEQAASTEADRISVTRADDDAAAIIYTSGTTGRAKGAVLSHGNFSANARALCAAWRITESDRYLAALPLFHVHGLANGVVSWLSSGCTMRLLERFDAANIAAEFDEFLPSLFFGVPTMYVRLLELERGVAERIGNSMRLFVSGSAPLPVHVHNAVHAAFGHWVLERYGMSETLMNCSNPYVGERRAGSVGPPLPGVAVRIVDEHMRDVPNGVVGEVLVRGPNVFQGYWRLPDASASAFVDGWFRTGDLGEQSDDGYVTLRGRRSEVIISAGFNIYPREIEEVLLEIPGVREAAIVSAPDDRRGEIPVAYIVAETSVSDAALADHCRRHLASFKLPRAFVRLDALPRTALGKIQKQLLPPFSSTDVMT